MADSGSTDITGALVLTENCMMLELAA